MTDGTEAIESTGVRRARMKLERVKIAEEWDSAAARARAEIESAGSEIKAAKMKKQEKRRALSAVLAEKKTAMDKISEELKALGASADSEE